MPAAPGQRGGPGVDAAGQVSFLSQLDAAPGSTGRYPAAPSSRRQRGNARGGAKGFLRWFTFGENAAVCGMALVVLVLHLLLVNTPPGPLSTPEWMSQDAQNKKDNTRPAPAPQYIFDELHYVPEAVRFLHREGYDPDTLHGIQRPEHPPLGKWLIAAGIFMFGDNPVGWRLLAILFATASIMVFYFICRHLVTREETLHPPDSGRPRQSRWAKWAAPSVFVPVLATFLFATENMSFVQGQVAMLDPFYLTFMLLGILYYLKGNYLASGAFMGLSMLVKAMAAVAVLGIVAHWAITRRGDIASEARFTWNALRGSKGTPSRRSEILGMARFAIAVPVLWLALLALLEYPATQQWANPLGRTLSMLSSHLSLVVGDTLASGIASRPWSWLYFPGGLYYWYTPHFLGSIGWTLWAFIVPSMAYLGVEVVRAHVRERQSVMMSLFGRSAWRVKLRRFLGPVEGHGLAKLVLAWFLSVYGLLIVLELATDRLMYHFYFYPAVPAVALAIAWGAWKLWQSSRRGRRWRVIFPAVLGVYILATVAAFVIMSPFGTDLITLPTLAPNVPASTT